MKLIRKFNDFFLFRSIRKVNDYQLGPEIKGSNTAGPLNCIKTFLAVKDDCFYRLKILYENPGIIN